ncbi:unnamed protein product [Clonostachys rosea f. rosea IK726]|uniref:Kinetochore protein Spc24 n=2 Tax=Bionectria ochroleuca TaxID=29856 RepID=A0A0B7JT38_BIOOC|nr:unnamed protein product [Clonostachys rosea f. rosea IK726]
MLLEEAPATLIHATIDNFNINQDRVAVARIGESLSTLQQARDLHLRDEETSLKKLNRQLNTFTSQYEDLSTAHSSADHASKISRLDTKKRRDAVDDEVLLRLKVYRSLGIDIERDERDGEWSKAVVRNDRKGDVHVVNMDKKFSRYFYANYFWSTL